jgi:type IV secretory pathway ATPase VirB11/archaellum biosynthesis ATPase
MFLKKIEKSEKKNFSYNVSNVGNKKILSIKFVSVDDCCFSKLVCRCAVFEVLASLGCRIDKLILDGNVKKIFDRDQVGLMYELVDVFSNIGEFDFCGDCKSIVSNYLHDPLMCYYKLKNNSCDLCSDKIIDVLEHTEFINRAIEICDVDLSYSTIFKPIVIPGIVSDYVEIGKPRGTVLDNYSVNDCYISIYNILDRPDNFYFLGCPEICLDDDELDILNSCFSELCNCELYIGIINSREYFKKLVSNILKKYKFVNREKILNILLRHSIGYGCIEILLQDEKIQDVYVDSGSLLVHVVHSEFGECITNLTLTKDSIDKLVTRLRIVSGRPMDTSCPVLHTELEEFGVRVCGIQPPSTYSGIGFAFRRRKKTPWSLIELASLGMINGKCAGLLSYLVDSQKSLLITGPRSSGKTSLLTALILEIPQNYRIIVIEDTPEIPVDDLRRLGFKIEHMKTEAFAKGIELSTEDALRTSLRLGNSVLVIGEVRGKEAKVLFEAMRIGAAGNVVLGTIHGSDAQNTFDRVVNDLGVPPSSFNAVNNIVSVGEVRCDCSTKRTRKLLEITKIDNSFINVVGYDKLNDVWDVKNCSEEVECRTKIKNDLILLHKKAPNLVTADFIVKSNNKFLEFASGSNDYKLIYNRWEIWLKTFY